jgi:hypothetical protein
MFAVMQFSLRLEILNSRRLTREPPLVIVSNVVNWTCAHIHARVCEKRTPVEVTSLNKTQQNLYL